MIKFVVILWLLPCLACAAYYRFDPAEPYNVDGIETAADTVYVQWYYDGDSSATHVLTVPEAGSTGLYQFDSTVAEAGRYLILWTFVDTTYGFRRLKDEIFIAQDTIDASGGGDTTGLALSVYAEFTVGSNEDQFKADVSALALETSVTAVRDSLDEAAQIANLDSIHNAIADLNKPNFMADVSALSTFDPDVDKVMVDSIDADVIGAVQIEAGAITRGSEAVGFVDSTFLSSFLRRLIFGIPQGTGADSTSLGERLVTASGLAAGDTNQYSLADIILAFADLVGDSNMARYSKREDYKADVSGLSTFDAATEKVTLVDSSADAIHDIRHEEAVNLNGWNPSSGIGLHDDTLATLMAWVKATLDTLQNQDNWVASESDLVGMSTFDPSAQPVVVGEILSGAIDDTAATNKFHERITDGVWGDTTTHFTQSGTYGKLAVEDSCCGGGGGSGDTNQYSLSDIRAMIEDVIGDSNIARYSKRDDYKATGFSTFNSASDKVTLVDSSALTIHNILAKLLSLGLRDSCFAAIMAADLGLYDSALAAVMNADLGLYDSCVAAITALFVFAGTDVVATLDGENVGIDANDVTGDFDHAAFEGDFYGQIGDTTRDALHDSLYSVRIDSILSLGIATKTYARNLVYYWGACDDCYYRLYPEGGFANKDSALIIDPSLGADSLVGKITYRHGTEDDVVDTSYFYVDEPW
jgi:hypothetical protein